MEKLGNFRSEKITNEKLKRIKGNGTPTSSWTANGQICDVWYDDNDNGVLDGGDCIDIVECK